jgi:hypothetical protein
VEEKTNKILPPPSARARLPHCRGREKGQTNEFASWSHNISLTLKSEFESHFANDITE